MTNFPAPPDDGGYLVLNASQIGNLDLLCLIKTVYPRTRIIARQPLPSGAAFNKIVRNDYLASLRTNSAH